MRLIAQASAASRLACGLEDRPGQKVRPIALEEWAALAVTSAQGPRPDDETLLVEADQDLPGSVFGALRQKSEVAERPCTRERHAPPFRAAHGARAAAPPSAADVECERGEHRLGGGRHLAPL